MAALSQFISSEHSMNTSIVYYKNKNAEPLDLKKEMLRKTIEYYKFCNSGFFDEESFRRDMIDILYSSLTNVNVDNNINTDKYYKIMSHLYFKIPRDISEVVIEMINNRENKRTALINKLKLERTKFLNSPTAKLMIQINKDYGKWIPDKELHELPLLQMTLSEEIEAGREERI